MYRVTSQLPCVIIRGAGVSPARGSRDGCTTSHRRQAGPLRAWRVPAPSGRLDRPGLGAESATTYTWDPGKTGASGGAGNWYTSSTNWWNGAADVAWPSATDSTDTAWFGNKTAVSATVTLQSPQSANALVFASSGYVLSGSTLTLQGTNPTISFSGTGVSGATTIASVLSLSPTGLTTNTASGTLTLSGSLLGTGNFTQNGGTVILSGTNSGYTGAYLFNTSGTAQGVLQLATPTISAALGGIAGITLQNMAGSSYTGAVQGTALNMTTGTATQTINLPPINMMTDPTNTVYRTGLIFAPAAANTVTVNVANGFINCSGVGLDQFYNTGSGTVAINSNIASNGATNLDFRR